MEDILKQLLQEDQELQFTSFNEMNAWQLGTQMVEHAMRENLPITIDITRGQHQLFHASMPVSYTHLLVRRRKLAFSLSLMTA